MIHTSKDLTIRSTNSRFPGEWSPATPIGDGFTVEGKLVEARNHSVCDKSGKYHRYLALVVDVSRTRIRVFTEQGEERDPQHISQDKVARKGYLNVYKKVDSDDPFRVDNESLQKAIGSDSSAIPDGYFDLQKEKLHPKVEGRMEFWGDAMKLKYHDLHMKMGSAVVIRTKGNSMFIDEVAAKEDAGSASYAAEKTGDDWTAKVFSHKSEGSSTTQESAPGDQCDAEEWD